MKTFQKIFNNNHCTGVKVLFAQKNIARQNYPNIPAIGKGIPVRSVRTE